MQKKIVVVFHSGYGHTKKQAEAVAKGAQATLIEISQEGEITEAEWALLDEADAIVFGTPTYMGMASWQFKKFADAAYFGLSGHLFRFHPARRFGVIRPA